VSHGSTALIGFMALLKRMARAASQASEQTLMAISGHVSRRMIEHYSHIRMEAKRAPLDDIAKPVSDDTVAQNWAQPTAQDKTTLANSLN
jgi:hypothetical protein